jgi:hypothetical protein
MYMILTCIRGWPGYPRLTWVLSIGKSSFHLNAGLVNPSIKTSAVIGILELGLAQCRALRCTWFWLGPCGALLCALTLRRVCLWVDGGVDPCYFYLLREKKLSSETFDCFSCLILSNNLVCLFSRETFGLKRIKSSPDEILPIFHFLKFA